MISEKETETAARGVVSDFVVMQCASARCGLPRLANEFKARRSDIAKLCWCCV